MLIINKLSVLWIAWQIGLMVNGAHGIISVIFLLVTTKIQRVVFNGSYKKHNYASCY